MSQNVIVDNLQYDILGVTSILHSHGHIHRHKTALIVTMGSKFLIKVLFVFFMCMGILSVCR